MAIIRPFKALRPDERVAHLVASLPYDVVNREEAANLAKGNPLSFLRVTRSEIEMPEIIDVYSSEVYQKAKENLQRLKNEAPLLIDESPNIYVYRLIMGTHSQVGLAATFSVVEYDNDIIKKHEKTRKDKEDDRTNHILITEAQTGPVFLTYRPVEEIDKIVNNVINKINPIYDFNAQDGINHTIWILPKEYVNKIINIISKVDKLYIADGHHRAASASRVQKIKKANNPNHTGEENYNFFLGVLFPSNQLKIMPYNRIIYKLKMQKRDFIEKIKNNFIVEETELKQPEKPRTFCMYLDNKWYMLKPTDNIKKSNKHSENLDVSILQNYLLQPILGIEDPRTDKNIDFIGGIRGTEELEKLVNNGIAEVAFSLHPVTLEDLMTIADANEIMPPKSTWFEPKLRDGLLIHLIS
ncbi:MAG: DUF1015 family protein [Melioribacter sp.]|nr:DUF1015 family protein [Melioribacter sp.]